MSLLQALRVEDGIQCFFFFTIICSAFLSAAELLPYYNVRMPRENDVRCCLERLCAENV